MSTKSIHVLALLGCALLSCSNDGDDRQTAPVIEEFSGAPDALTAAADVTLRWSVQGATSLSIDPEVGEVTGTSVTTKVYAPTTFTLTATNTHGSATATTKVTVTLSAFTGIVDPSIRPNMLELAGAGPIAASVDEAGTQTDFVVDQVRIKPRNQAELDAFLVRVGGIVVGDDAVPAAPPQSGLDVAAPPTEYLVHFDSAGTSTATLTTDAVGAGIGGATRFSSQRALEFFAAVTHEAASGIRVWPNFMSYGSAVLLKTQERRNGDGVTFLDAFDATIFPRLQNTGSRASVVQAWQWVQSHGVARDVTIAIIDGGFWLDALGQPLAGPGDTPDFQAVLWQYDFGSRRYVADGTNPASCSGGAGCPWHGAGTMSAAASLVNNQAGAAGSGGTVATPMLFKVNGSRQQEHSAVLSAIAWGADVINLSLSGPCNVTCRGYERDDNVYARAAEAGRVVVAAAGNDSNDVFGDDYYHPCISDSVICVGALNDEGTTRTSYSNYGAGVDIWAPTNITATTDALTPGVIATFGGTSSSSPLVAGIAAMMKAIDPTLTGDQVQAILRATAWTDSSDPTTVTHMVNALRAVRAAAHETLPPDALEPNEDDASAEPITSAMYADLRVSSPADIDTFTFTLPGKSSVDVNLTYASGIGAPVVRNGGVNGTSSCGAAIQTSDVTDDKNTNRTISYLLPQGTYSLAVGGKTALPYDLRLTSVAAYPAVPDDAYEPNETLETPYYLNGNRVVVGTLPILDSDFFSMYSSGSYTQSVFTFSTVAEILSADGRVTLTVYDAGGQPVATSTTSVDCATQARVNIPVGTHRIEVTSTAFGNYVMHVGGRITDVVQYVDADLYQITPDPGVAFELLITQPVEWALIGNQSDLEAQTLQVFTPNIHAQIFGTDGTVVGEGVATDFQGTTGETVTTPLSTANGSMLVRFARVLEGGASVAGSPAVRVGLNLVQTP